jgi:Fic family protein
MLYGPPKIAGELAAHLAELDDLRRRLGAEANVAAPWLGDLRRRVQASAAQSSISIEGFHVPEGEAAEILAGGGAGEDEDRQALACYARAMDHVGVLAADPGFHWSERVILDLHFDACWFQREHSPGRWRTGPIGVTSPGGGDLAYRGPDGDAVPGLMAEVVAWLERGDLDAPAVVRAALAHLHLLSVHPFRDGNGRLARIVQSLVLAREGLLAPELGSIEEYLGRHTPAYYAALVEVQRGSYQPQRDTTRWVAFCVEAHLAQARHRLAQLAQAAARWRYLEDLVAHRGWPERLTIALEQSLFEGASRASYAAEADISPASASADLRRLLDGGLVVRRGRGRTLRHVASDALRAEVRAAAG